jgi:hypothetical protein
MALNCGPNWFSGSSSFTAPVPPVPPVVRVALMQNAQGMAFATANGNAWTQMLADYNLPCPVGKGCDHKRGSVAFSSSVQWLKAGVQCTCNWILFVDCAPERFDGLEAADYETQKELYEEFQKATRRVP